MIDALFVILRIVALKIIADKALVFAKPAFLLHKAEEDDADGEEQGEVAGQFFTHFLVVGAEYSLLEFCVFVFKFFVEDSRHLIHREDVLELVHAVHFMLAQLQSIGLVCQTFTHIE